MIFFGTGNSMAIGRLRTEELGESSGIKEEGESASASASDGARSAGSCVTVSRDGFSIIT